MKIKELFSELERLMAQGAGDCPVLGLMVDASLPPLTILEVALEHHEDAGNASTVWLKLEET